VLDTEATLSSLTHTLCVSYVEPSLPELRNTGTSKEIVEMGRCDIID
jgi:hypothetical protein